MSQPTQEEIAQIREQLDDLPSLGAPIYETKDQSIYRFQINDRDLIAKCYQLRTLAQKTAALFKRSRAHRSLRAGLRFHEAGINTPRPLLLAAEGKFIPDKAILVTDYCPFPALRNSLRDNQPVHPSTPGKILNLLHQLSQLNCSHGDFHARNLLVDDEGIPHLIDLDGVRGHSSSGSLSRYICQDRDRFLKSLEPLPEHYRDYSAVLGEPESSLPPLPSGLT